MYALYKQTHPPTGIEHCVYCNFFNTSERNLVIAAVNQLDVYRLIPEIDDDENPDKWTESKRKQKLESVATFSLFGNIMSMQFVKLPGAHRDALLLSFMDAKLSVVEYDPGTHDLQTTSLHYFEESIMKDGFSTNYDIPTIRVDPDGRCAAMLIYGNRLVILPFRRDALMEETENVVGASKSPIMSSYIIDLRQFDEKIPNVKDFQFLHGYYEPTVFILYEPLQTWTGRTAVRADSCSIVAISLNIQERVHPIIWSLASLPFDCHHVMPVPRPIGGVLVMAVNSLLYLNQSVPPYGVALNSIAHSSTAFPLRSQEGVRITLDCAEAAFMSYDRLILSLKGGELYVLTLVVDGMRSVRSFHFDKAAASVLTTCMCVLDDGYLLLGSRLGNSLLLRYTEKVADADHTNGENKNEPPTKKKKTDGTTDMASDVTQVENLYDLEVYGSAENPSGTMITSYSFEVCDNIWNIAPCGQCVMGEPAFLSEEFAGNPDPDLELVTTSGYGKNGALSVLQRSIRPQVVTTFELPGCVNMWTVKGTLPTDTPLKTPAADEEEKEDKEETKEDKDEIENGHAFLILSRTDSSMILQTGQEIMELDHSGFSTQTATIFAGNIGNDKYIIQVSATGVRLLEGVKQIQHIPVDIGSPLVHCSLADPYVLLMASSGQIAMLTMKEDINGVRLVTTRPSVSQHSRLLTLCLYKDLSGMFTTMTTQFQEEVETTTDTKEMKPSTEKAFTLDTDNIDDEDELLYGETDTSVFTSSFDISMRSESEGPKREAKSSAISPTYWALMCRENGVLEIYSVPDFKMSYYVKNFPMGQKILVDSVQMTDKVSTSGMGMPGGERQEKIVGDMPNIKELLMVGLGYRNSRSFLFARVDDEFYIYEAFPFHQTPVESHLKLRFKKVQHNVILRERRTAKYKRKMDPEDGEESLQTTDTTMLHYFSDLAGYNGVFICGAYPHWIFMTTRGCLRIHPMGIDGRVTCFSPFHNVNCPKGFLYFNGLGELRISVLPTHLTYDSPWPVRKVPLRCTPHFIAYHPESKIYSVVHSVPELCNYLPKPSEEREFDVIEKDERFVYPNMKRFIVQLYSPTSWEVVPNTKIELDQWEHATIMKCVSLKSEGTLTGYKSYGVIGTTVCYGEEVQCRGRILIYDIIEVVPEPGQPLTKNKIKVVYAKEQKGPITALAHICGLLVTAIGQKLYIWQFKNDDLEGVAFIDSYIFIHNLVTVKNLIMASDLLKNINIYRYQEDFKVLSLVSRDVKPSETYASQFLIDNSLLSFVVTDSLKNIIVYTYQPEARESHGGHRLVRKAEFNAGSHINTMFRVRCRIREPGTDRRMTGAVEKRNITYFATLDGGLGFLLPVSEKVYRRLFMLQNALTTQLPHLAGLNPRAYRTLKQSCPELRNLQKNILDGELLWKYPNLSVMEKTEIAKRIGTSADQILEDLMETDRLTAHF
ncbi:cleavage and polyadenylation specificity factor subunit 1-like [Ylistrum balloti]|uniref:cleavage and polyadenylation specificity factor subunit 1-like n=1 Tax=Ylistrum balloti TaxID=509963 RepID=UPI002905DE48|nr:cleavage and polyadenylation specificity factor subunit 1-like [Ylistrum balloti]XP_060076995.1 cleavage and polyadenylation specificity factor subunit 1-like [Ylistrum balloti]